MRLNFGLLGLVVFATMLSACATVSRGATDYLRIDTIPQGAKVTSTIETKESKRRSKDNPAAIRSYRGCAPTPCLIKVGRRQRLAIKIEHEGYEPAEIAINGDLKSASVSMDMAVPAQSAATEFALSSATMALGAEYTIAGVRGITVIIQAFTFQPLNPAVAPTAGIASSATQAAVGIGAAMVAIDLASGSYSNVYPNPVIIKLAPKGTPTVTDPNMLMFKLRQAKQHIAYKYCTDTPTVSAKRAERNCRIAREIDRKNDEKNAELLAHEQDIRDMIAKLKIQIKEARARARQAAKQKRQSGSVNESGQPQK